MKHYSCHQLSAAVRKLSFGQLAFGQERQTVRDYRTPHVLLKKMNTKRCRVFWRKLDFVDLDLQTDYCF